jgi:hypothetical protein
MNAAATKAAAVALQREAALIAVSAGAAVVAAARPHALHAPTIAAVLEQLDAVTMMDAVATGSMPAVTSATHECELASQVLQTRRDDVLRLLRQQDASAACGNDDDGESGHALAPALARRDAAEWQQRVALKRAATHLKAAATAAAALCVLPPQSTGAPAEEQLPADDAAARHLSALAAIAAGHVGGDDDAVPSVLPPAAELRAALCAADAAATAVTTHAKALQGALAAEAAALRRVSASCTAAPSVVVAAAVATRARKLLPLPVAAAKARAVARAVEQNAAQLAQSEAAMQLRADAIAGTQHLAAARAAALAAQLAMVSLDADAARARLMGTFSGAAAMRYATQRAALAAAERAATADIEHHGAGAPTEPLLDTCYPEVAALLARTNSTAAEQQAARGAHALLPVFEPSDYSSLRVLRRTAQSTVLLVRRRVGVAPNNSSADAADASTLVMKTFRAADDAGFRREAAALCALVHPLVLPLLGAVCAHGRAHLLLPHCSGGNLRSWTDAQARAGACLGLAGWRAVRGTFRQLLTALAFIHSRGVAHRDIKPEHVMWRAAPHGGEGAIVLAGFGISRAAANALATPPPSGTPAYAAPESLSGSGSGSFDEAHASDMWSLGIWRWRWRLRRACWCAGTPHASAWSGRRAPAEARFWRCRRRAPRQLQCRNGWQEWMAFALSLTAAAPSERCSADEALQHPFFGMTATDDADIAAADAGCPAEAASGRGASLATKLILLADAVAAQRRAAIAAAAAAASEAGAPPVTAADLRITADAEGDELVKQVLDAVMQLPTDASLLALPWRAWRGATREPLRGLLSRFFTALPGVSEPVRLVEDATGGGDADRALLPAAAAGECADACSRLNALGCLMAKCALEGLPCSALEWAPSLCAALLNRDMHDLSHAGGALALLSAFDAEAAGAHRRTLGARLGAGNALLTADMYSDAWREDERVTDGNKRELVAHACAATLAGGSRAAALDACREGFDITVQAMGASTAVSLLEPCELGMLLNGDTGVDDRGSTLQLSWHDDVDAQQREWFLASLAALSPSALRLLYARATGRLVAPSEPVHVSTADDEDMPRLPSVPHFSGHASIVLPRTCPSAEAFTARLLFALGVDADMHAPPSSSAGGGGGIDATERRAALRAVQATGDALPGACYTCPNGHVYVVGDCGGAVIGALCAECDAPIGGNDHVAADGNALRLDLDGAEEPAWGVNFGAPGGAAAAVAAAAAVVAAAAPPPPPPPPAP